MTELPRETYKYNSTISRTTVGLHTYTDDISSPVFVHEIIGVTNRVHISYALLNKFVYLMAEEL